MATVVVVWCGDRTSRGRSTDGLDGGCCEFFVVAGHVGLWWCGGLEEQLR